MTAIEIISIILSVLTIIAFSFMIYFLWVILPRRMNIQKNSIVGNRAKQVKTLEKKINREFEQMIINENPMILQHFPESVDYASTRNLVPELGGSLMLKLLFGVLNSVGNNPEAPAALQAASQLSSAIGADTASSMLQLATPLIKKIFGSNKKTAAKSDKIEKKELKASTPAVRPANYQ